MKMHPPPEISHGKPLHHPEIYELCILEVIILDVLSRSRSLGSLDSFFAVEDPYSSAIASTSRQLLMPAALARAASD